MPDSYGKRQSSPKTTGKEKNKGAPKIGREGSKEGDSEIITSNITKENDLPADAPVDEISQQQNGEEVDVSADPVEPSQPKKLIPRDVMRLDPILLPLVVLTYKGETDENGFYHGNGFAEFRGGHCYKGEFVKGSMHGHGKYTWNDGICFIGSFEHNVISGKGQYLWPNGNFYEGDVSNGKRHGKGKYHCAHTQSIYEGEWLAGKRHGKGILYFNKTMQSYYDGYWVDNKKCGQGIIVYKSGNKYEGSWANDLRHGKGHMHWYDRGEEYMGSWDNGAMSGFGTYTWYIKRASNSQYPLRNQYYGQFVNGLRDGNGTFHYASGAIYAGKWVNNKKHGKGKFTFKNGLTFDGVFEYDRIVGHPDMVLSGFTTPDIDNSGLPVRSQTPIRAGTPTGTTDSIEINLTPLYQEHRVDIEYQVKETEEVSRILLQHISSLRTVYRYYSGLGQDNSVDNTYILSLFQMWRLLKDAGVAREHISLAEIDRVAALTEESLSNPHNPFRKIFFRDFINMLIIVAFRVCGEGQTDAGSRFSSSLSEFLPKFLLARAFSVNGSYFCDVSKTAAAKSYLDFCYEVYLYFVRKKRYPDLNSNKCLTMRDFLFTLKDLKLINEQLKAKDAITFLLADVQDEEETALEFDLNFELVFLDIFEALIDCSQYYVTDDICESYLRSIDQTPEQSIVQTLGDGVEEESKHQSFADNELLVESPSSPDKDSDGLPSGAVDQFVEPAQLNHTPHDSVDKRKIDKQEREVSSREKTKDQTKSSEGKGKSKKDEKNSVERHDKKDKNEGKYGGKRSGEAITLRRDKSKDLTVVTSHEGKHKGALSVKEFGSLEGEIATPPIIVTSSSENHVEEIVKTQLHQPEIISPTQSIIQQDSGHPILKIQSMTNMEMWSLKLKIFMENYLQPAFKHRKVVDEILEMKRR